MAYVRKSVSIRIDQEKWVRKTHLNLSRFLQAALDKQIGKEK